MWSRVASGESLLPLEQYKELTVIIHRTSNDIEFAIYTGNTRLEIAKVTVTGELYSDALNQIEQNSRLRPEIQSEVFKRLMHDFKFRNSPPETNKTLSRSILFLAADPTDASRLRLGEELREIQEKLRLAKLRDEFELHQRMSVRPADISQALLDIQPQIVHFSGHGTSSGALCFENQIGETHPIQPESLAALFEQFTKQISCVVLNACYSEKQANAIALHIDYVIGMSHAIGDKAAIAFAIGFYQALGAGRSTEEAYKFGCVQIRLQNIPEHLTPVLFKNGKVQA